MAAMRSALAMLGRRSCGSSGSSAAASMVGGIRLKVHQSLPLLRPSARNLELQGLKRFSTSGMEGADQKKPLLMKHKDENVLRLWWQRSRDHVKNYRSTSSDYPYAKDCRSIHVFGTLGCLAMFSYLGVIIGAMHLHNDGRTNMGVHCAMYSTYPFFWFPGYQCVQFPEFGGNFVTDYRGGIDLQASSRLDYAHSWCIW